MFFLYNQSSYQQGEIDIPIHHFWKGYQELRQIISKIYKN